MKIKLFFDSVDEFTLFIISTSSLSLDFSSSLGGYDGCCYFQELGKVLPTETYWPFLDHVFGIQVGNATYSVENTQEYVDLHRRYPEADYTISNFMLNEVQMKADCIWAKGATDGESVEGSENVRELVKKLPNRFLLNVGWRTDYRMYLFCKSTLDV